MTVCDLLVQTICCHIMHFAQVHGATNFSNHIISVDFSIQPPSLIVRTEFVFPFKPRLIVQMHVNSISKHHVIMLHVVKSKLFLFYNLSSTK